MGFTHPRQMSLAEEPLCYFETAALGEIPAIGDENVPDVFGIVDEINSLGPDPKIDDVSITAGEVRQESERVPAEPEEGPRETDTRSGRQNITSSCSHRSTPNY